MFSITQLTKNVQVYSLPASRVSRYFCINAKNRTAKKKLAVELVRRLLDPRDPVETPLGNKLTVPDDLVEYFKGQSKQDDLSDCLLQALAIMEWNYMAQQL